MMSHYYQGGLIPVNNHAGTKHKIDYIRKDGIHETREVNSYHRWGINNLPVAYEIVAKCQEENVESIRHKELEWEGCMWHPERDISYDCRDIRRIKALFNS